MAFIIPNAGDTGSGQRYANINQAEPDSLDIEALGLRNNWVRSGCAVSASSDALSVTAGVVVIGGTPYAVSAFGPSSVTRATNARFDLVIGRLSGSSVSIVVLSGTDSSTNPTLPKSRSVLAYDGLFDSNSHVDPATDVLLGAVYVTAAETGSSSVVDKRVVDTRPVTRTSASTPTDSDNDVTGDVVIYNDAVYVKVNSTTWTEMAKMSDVAAAGVPVGSIFAWPGTGSPSGNYLECDGASISRTTYAALFAIIGTTYGSVDGNHFNLPKLDDDRTIFGSNSGNVGLSGGENSVTLTLAQTPAHTHAVSVGAHSALTHSVTVDTQANHTHTTREHDHQGAVIYRSYGDHNGFHIAGNSDGNHAVNASEVDAFHVDVIDINEGSTSPFTGETDAVETDGKTVFRSNSNPSTYGAGSHTHVVTVAQHNISSHVVTEASRGSGSAVDTKPKYLNMRWFIRYA